MAIQIEGTLKTEWGNTDNAYVRIEFYKVKPWEGHVEYNPVIYLTSSDAVRSRKMFYQDEFAQPYSIPLRDMEYESGSITGSVELAEFIQFPLTSSATSSYTLEHWGEVWTSSSQEFVDFDEDGNEVVETRWVSSSEWTHLSSSTVTGNPIQLDSISDIYSDCYVHLKRKLSDYIPSSSLLDV